MNESDDLLSMIRAAIETFQSKYPSSKISYVMLGMVGDRNGQLTGSFLQTSGPPLIVSGLTQMVESEIKNLKKSIIDTINKSQESGDIKEKQELIDKLNAIKDKLSDPSVSDEEKLRLAIKAKNLMENSEAIRSMLKDSNNFNMFDISVEEEVKLALSHHIHIDDAFTGLSIMDEKDSGDSPSSLSSFINKIRKDKEDGFLSSDHDFNINDLDKLS